MIYAAPGETIEPLLSDAPAGLVGTLTVRVIDPPTGTVIVPETTNGIVEIAAGSYVATIDLPDLRGRFVVLWKNGATEIPEELVVTGSSVGGMPSTFSPELIYAQVSDYRTYSGDTTTSDDDVTRALSRSEANIDNELGAYPLLTTGRKLAPSQLPTYQADKLTAATCAQAEYRLTMGEDFFIRGQHASVAGPDYTVQGKLPIVGPKALTELEGSGLYKLTTSWHRAGASEPPWSSFAYNLEDDTDVNDDDPLPRQAL